ncbi:flagellar motor protein MotA [Acetobacter sp. AN02]|uniref:flagellar motor protein MotA n=1 Tax=Acetobacter sp. AN02 TaxID=2894186 RepID=UPI00243460D5|nr:flagellar motor protein MotA [Acetobacter sp. AN02]MDG6094411.1 flagellar motor protein MotA [Acetobacter sp. AN02]
MTRPTTFLFRMIAFLVAVLCVAGLLRKPLAAAFFNNPLLDGFILFTLAVGIGWTLLLVLRLRPEVAWVETVQHDRESLLRAPPPKMLSALSQALTPRREGSRVTLSTPALQSILDSISGRLGEGREISRYLTSLLIFLGLLGTFYGLLLTVSAIADVIAGMSVGDSDLNAMFGQLKSGLAKPLHGMGTAFSGSLFGLAGALVVGFLDLLAGQAQNRFFNELEEWLVSFTRLSSVAAPVADGEAGVPAYVQALLEQTAENMEGLQVLLRAGEAQRMQQMELLSRLDTHIGALAGLRKDTDELRAIREHMRVVEQLLSRMAAEGERERAQGIADLRGDLRLLTRTLAAAAGQQGA